jgi:MoxR-like ATPase
MARELLVRDYNELDDFVEAFVGGHYELLVLLGDPGTGKTETRRVLQRVLGNRFGSLTGFHTDLALYKELYG